MDRTPDIFTGDFENLWRLYREATGAVIKHLDACLKNESDVKLTDYYILLALVQAGHRDDASSALRMGDLADQTNVSPSRLTYQIDVLQRRGWVEKAPVASDRRGKGILLTAAGREAYKAAGKVYNREVDNIVFRELNSRNIAACTAFFEGILCNVAEGQQERSLP